MPAPNRRETSDLTCKHAQKHNTACQPPPRLHHPHQHHTCSFIQSTLTADAAGAVGPTPRILNSSSEQRWLLTAHMSPAPPHTPPPLLLVPLLPTAQGSQLLHTLTSLGTAAAMGAGTQSASLWNSTRARIEGCSRVEGSSVMLDTRSTCSLICVFLCARRVGWVAGHGTEEWQQGTAQVRRRWLVGKRVIAQLRAV